MLPWIGLGRSPFRTAGNDEQASAVILPAGGKPEDTREARSVVALSRVLRWRAECAGFASGCRSGELRKLALPQAAVRPLVRTPTDRHTATGTCEFGRARYRRFRRERQENFIRIARANASRPAKLPNRCVGTTSLAACRLRLGRSRAVRGKPSKKRVKQKREGGHARGNSGRRRRDQAVDAAAEEASLTSRRRVRVSSS